MAKGDVVHGPDGERIVLADVGHRIVLENDLLRVWEVLLEPGEVQPWHRHHHPYLVVAVEEAHNRMDFLDGSEPRTMHETVGRVVYRPAGKVHKLTNEGSTRYRSRLIELKLLGEDAEGRP